MSSGEFKIDYQKKAIPGKVKMIGLLLLAIGIILTALSFMADHTRASFNIVIIFMFVASIGLGSLFLVAIEYLSGAVWSVPFRRISEIMAALLFIAPIVALPAFFNLHDLFHWTHTEAVEADVILKGKSPYLNVSFFIIRFAVIFILMWLFYVVLTRRSAKQDTSNDQKLTKRNIVTSAIFIPIFGIGITLLSIDWMMSMEPHWYSTIFGVYYFSGSLLAALAAVTFIAVSLNENGYLIKGVTKDHYYSLGALMFAFTNFWAYIAFSQYLLIYYANLPEETFWFLARNHGSWLIISIGMIFIHFAVPYVLLLSQPSKKDPVRLKIASVWILFAHLYDLYWLVMPNFDKESAPFGWMELSVLFLAGGILIFGFVFFAGKKNLVPIGDPKMERSLNFKL